MQQNPETEPGHAERNPENPEEQGDEGEGTSQGDNLMMRKMRMVGTASPPHTLFANAGVFACGWSCVLSRPRVARFACAELFFFALPRSRVRAVCPPFSCLCHACSRAPCPPTVLTVVSRSRPGLHVLCERRHRSARSVKPKRQQPLQQTHPRSKAYAARMPSLETLATTTAPPGMERTGAEKDAGQQGCQISFHGIMVLAPMVRISTLPLRLLALEMGADLVWTEEMVAKKVVPCERVENQRLGTTEFYDRSTPWTRVWQTCAAEKARVVFQIGASTPEDAVAAAKVVEKDVAVFCLNMGCPKEFSVKNGMGAALLKSPQHAASIISALKRNVSQPIVAKIRLKNSTEDTIALMRCLEDAGVSAITVHVRHVNERSSEPARRAELRILVDAVSVPVLGNGDVVDFADAQRWREESGCAGVMVVFYFLFSDI